MLEELVGMTSPLPGRVIHKKCSGLCSEGPLFSEGGGNPYLMIVGCTSVSHSRWKDSVSTLATWLANKMSKTIKVVTNLELNGLLTAFIHSYRIL